MAGAVVVRHIFVSVDVSQFLDAGNAHQGLLFLQLDQPHALCVAALQRNLVDASAHQRTLVADQHDLVAVSDLHGAHHGTVAFTGLDADDTLAATALGRELGDHGTFAVAVFTHGQDLPAFSGDDHVDYALAGLQADATHAACCAAHLADVFLAEADGLAGARVEHDVAGAVGNCSLDQLVAFVQLDGTQAHAALVAVGSERRFLHRAVGSGKEDEIVVLVHTDRQEAVDALPLFQRQDVDDRLAARSTAGQWNLVDLEPVDLAEAGEAQQGVMAAGHQQVLDVVLVLDACRCLAHATTALGLVIRERLALGIATARNGDHAL